MPTQTLSERIRPLSLVLLYFTLILLPGMARSAEQDLSQPRPQTGSQRFITIDFDNVDILLFIKYISELTGKNFIIDKTVKGTVSIISPTKISEEEAYRVFESVLDVNGFTTIESGSMIKIMPSVRARTENIDTLSHGRTSNPEDRIVTQLIPLTHSTPDEMKKVLAPLVSKTSVVIAHTQSGMLIVTDTLSNIQKLLSIIKTIDVDYSSDELEVVSLENATASTLATTISSIFQSSNIQKGSRATSGIKIVSYDRINALIILAGPGDILRVKRLVAMLDSQPEQNEGNIQVVYLQHATAKDLAAVLTNLPGQQTGTDGPNKLPAISKDVKIMADEQTNSLIITASRSEFKVLENVIKKLDIARRMVYIEALIMEVNTDTTFEVGVNWLGAGAFSDNTGALVSGWGGSDGFAMDGAISTNDDGAVSVGTGFSLGVLKQGIEIGGITFPNIAAILKAYKSNSNFNIISTPQLLTTDNQKAEISVGENRPYLTRTSEADSGTGYQNYEYKDIATKLIITPQINQADTLRLEISTEVSKLNTSASEVDRPVTFKRTAETTVLVQDNDTIVIGGIIGHDATEAEWKIPLLGDIPILGWLFKTHNTSHLKTNMFIFITPHIIKNPADIARVTLTKEEQLDKVMPEVKEQLHQQTNLDHALSLSDIGFQRMQAQRYDEAENFFKEALDINPNSPYALMNLGVICEQKGRTIDAIKYYQQVIDNREAIGNGGTEDPGSNTSNLKEICREHIERLKKQADDWPYPENNVQ
ncbi:MAG: type II secretion system secretin GspD [Proteobacteria bacterium]|nr:type II secretion system secretin GspD [Pseudomonadota bacterium]MBU1058036.1 type II secretion system secretin GspD [Pseudomonadota bacterium]